MINLGYTVEMFNKGNHDVYYKKPYEIMWEANEKLYSLFDWNKYEQMLKETTK